MNKLALSCGLSLLVLLPSVSASNSRRLGVSDMVTTRQWVVRIEASAQMHCGDCNGQVGENAKHDACRYAKGKGVNQAESKCKAEQGYMADYKYEEDCTEGCKLLQEPGGGSKYWDCHVVVKATCQSK